MSTTPRPTDPTSKTEPATDTHGAPDVPDVDVVVLAHDRKLDVPALAAALEAGCRFVGQIGGSRTQRIRREALAERGFGEEELDRIRGPVGLDIGAQGPQEIAVSILSEVVAVRRGSPLA